MVAGRRQSPSDSPRVGKGRMIRLFWKVLLPLRRRPPAHRKSFLSFAGHLSHYGTFFCSSNPSLLSPQPRHYLQRVSDTTMLSASQLSRLFEDFPNIDSVASATQSLTYLGRILLHNRDLHGETATQKCQEMISDHPELHTVLKDCYNAKDFAPLLISGKS